MTGNPDETSADSLEFTRESQGQMGFLHPFRVPGMRCQRGEVVRR